MNQEKLIITIRRPRISEKATRIASDANQYTFEVLPSANKAEIKSAVELMFGVKVKDVNVLNVKGKRKRFKQLPGKRSNWKKAYVSLHPGQTIDLMNKA